LGFGKTKNILPDSIDVVTKGDKFLIGPQIKLAVSKNIVVRALAFYRHVTGAFYNEGIDSSKTAVPSFWQSQTNDWQAESQGIITLGSSNVITAGLEFLNNSADFGATINPATGKILPNSFSTRKAIQNGAGFIQDEIKLLDRLNIVPALRLDYQSEFGGALSPKLGISYKVLDPLTFRTSAGRSFRAPSLAELYLPDLQINPSFVLKANPNLSPEYVWGFDAAFDVVPLKPLTVTLGTFYNSMKDLISQTLINDSAGTYVSHRNIIAAYSEGLEGEMEWRPLKWLRLSTHGTLQNSKDLSTGSMLDYVPNFLFGGQAGASHKFSNIKVEGELGFNYVGKRKYVEISKDSLQFMPDGSLKLKPFFVNLASYNTVEISCKISLKQNLWLCLTAQNILNAIYEESGGTYGPGAFATVKIGYGF
ncbi:MAG: TonB-dependent receptor, partial [Chitinivibrionales bacterium]|nr:TonB-dependent receptor [Chitinivibrionales bacterium]